MFEIRKCYAYQRLYVNMKKGVFGQRQALPFSDIAEKG